MTGRLAYTPDEVAAAFGVNVSTVYRAIKAGRIPAKRLGPRRLIIPASALHAWLEAA